MTNPTDSGPDGGAKGVPTPNVSQEGDKQNSAVNEAFLEALVARLKPEIERTVQSTKDKRLKDLDSMKKRIDDLESVKSYLDANGGDVSKAAKAMAIDQLLDGNGRGATPSTETNTLSPFEKRTAKVLKAAGIADDDPAVLELLKKSYASEDDWIDDLTALGLSKKSATPAPTPTPSSGSGAVFDGKAKDTNTLATDEELIGLYAQLDELNRQPVAKALERTKVRARILELGGSL